MAYEKRTWVSGVTKCSAENFNHMEDGIETAQKGVDELNTNLPFQNTKVYTGTGANYIEIRISDYSNTVGKILVTAQNGDWTAFNAIPFGVVWMVDHYIVFFDRAIPSGQAIRINSVWL